MHFARSRGRVPRPEDVRLATRGVVEPSERYANLIKCGSHQWLLTRSVELLRATLPKRNHMHRRCWRVLARTRRADALSMCYIRFVYI